MKYIFHFLLIFILSNQSVNGQCKLFEADTIDGNTNATLPFDRCFYLKIRIEGDAVSHVYIMTKKGNADIETSLAKGNKFKEIPINNYKVKTWGGKNYLIIEFSETLVLKPDEAFYLVYLTNKIEQNAFDFFDYFYQYTLDKSKKTTLSKSLKYLQAYYITDTTKFRGIAFGTIDSATLLSNLNTFEQDFNLKLKKSFDDYYKYISIDSIIFSKTKPRLPYYESLSDWDFLRNKMLEINENTNTEAQKLISSKGILITINNLNYLIDNKEIETILNGQISLKCAMCEKNKQNVYAEKSLQTRITNIDTTISYLTSLRNIIFLVENKNPSIVKVDSLIKLAIYYKDNLKNITKAKSKISKVISDSIFAYNIELDTVGASFFYSVPSNGNTYLAFDAKAKYLVTPDLGLVTSNLFNSDLKYSIIPYVGFHINMMPLDKDLKFCSYKKDWKQCISLGVGWTLINEGADSTGKYESFFEKSALMTGVGLRCSNFIRITAGTQWLFEKSEISDGQFKTELTYIPYIGLSFDFNVQQYLNGFVDILSGIKTSSTPQINTNTP